MAKNYNFGGNLIWRMAKNVNFGGFLTNPPNPRKFLPLRYIELQCYNFFLLQLKYTRGKQSMGAGGDMTWKKLTRP